MNIKRPLDAPAEVSPGSVAKEELLDIVRDIDVAIKELADLEMLWQEAQSQVTHIDGLLVFDDSTLDHP